MKYVFFLGASFALLVGCGEGSGGDANGDGAGDDTSGSATATDSDEAMGADEAVGGSGGATGSDDVTGGDASMGGSGGATGGASPPRPIVCSPDLSERMVPCQGTPAEVPTQTKSFSVSGPFAAGDTVAVSVQASSGLGMTVQAFSEQSTCEGPLTTIGEVVVPNADYSCAEVTLAEPAQAVHFEFLDDSVAYPALFAVCGGCP
jgi:hypothetical protein